MKPVLPVDKLLHHLIHTRKKKVVKINTQPRTNAEFLEEHIRGEITEQLLREVNSE